MQKKELCLHRNKVKKDRKEEGMRNCYSLLIPEPKIEHEFQLFYYN